MSEPDSKDILSGTIVRWTMFTFGFALIFVGVFSTINVSVGSGTVIIVTGLAFILLAVFEVQSLELLGLSAKLKGRINEVEILLEKIRKVSVPLTQLAVSVSIRSGRWDSYIPAIKIYTPLKEIEKELINKGVTQLDEFNEIKNEVIQNLIRELNELLISKIKDSLNVEYQKLDLVQEALNEASRTQNIDKINNLLSQMQALTQETYKVNALEQEDIAVRSSKIRDYLLGDNSVPLDKKTSFIKEVDEIDKDIEVLHQTGEIRRPDILKEVM